MLVVNENLSMESITSLSRVAARFTLLEHSKLGAQSAVLQPDAQI